MLRPPVILVILCIVGKIIRSLFPKVATEGTQINLPYKGNIKVVVVCTPKESWYDIALHVLSQSSAPLNLKVEMQIHWESAQVPLITILQPGRLWPRGRAVAVYSPLIHRADLIDFSTSSSVSARGGGNP